MSRIWYILIFFLGTYCGEALIWFHKDDLLRDKCRVDPSGIYIVRLKEDGKTLEEIPSDKYHKEFLVDICREDSGQFAVYIDSTGKLIRIWKRNDGN